MIIREFYETRKDGVKLYRTYSNLGMYILQNETNIEYGEAIDVESATYTYSETNKPIEEEIATEEDYIQALNEMGVNFNE